MSYDTNNSSVPVQSSVVKESFQIANTNFGSTRANTLIHLGETKHSATDAFSEPPDSADIDGKKKLDLYFLSPYSSS